MNTATETNTLDELARLSKTVQDCDHALTIAKRLQARGRAIPQSEIADLEAKRDAAIRERDSLEGMISRYCAAQPTIPVERTSTYPTRYAAFDRPGVLFVHDTPLQSGGHEWAVFSTPTLYGSIVSYQDQGFYVEVTTGPHPYGPWKAKFSQRMAYNYDHAQRRLIEELTKLLPA